MIKMGYMGYIQTIYFYIGVSEHGVYPNMVNHQNSEYLIFSIKATSPKKRSGMDDKLLMTSS
jgi:hypothetical protein